MEDPVKELTQIPLPGSGIPKLQHSGTKLKEEKRLRNAFSAANSENEDFDCNGDDVGEKLADLYKNLQILRSDAAEAQALKILAGLGFTKEMQCCPTRSFSGGWRMRISLENGTVSTFPGTFQEYKEQLQKEIKPEVDD